MSALGHKRTCAAQNVMSALPPKADICSALAHVCFVPIADIAIAKWDLGGCRPAAPQVFVHRVNHLTRPLSDQ